MQERLFVFDLDDTLLYNKHNYSQPMLDAVSCIIQAIGPKAPYAPDILAIIDQVDRERVNQIDPTTGKPYLYNRRRFPGSLAAAYEKVCQKSGVEPQKTVEKKLRAIGKKAFSRSNYHRNIHPHAKKVLAFLTAQQIRLVLCSKGDPEIQLDKFEVMKSAGINCFEQWLIVDKKDTAVFDAIRQKYPRHACISVGNMYRSDILPALQAGFSGVYIPDEHWESSNEKEDVLKQIDTGQCIVLNDLGELILRFEELPQINQ